MTAPASDPGTPPLILAIESSCDETAAAVLDGPDSLRSSVVHSQVDIHRQYGGVVPELASRNHILAIDTVVADALQQAGAAFQDLRGVAVTAGPGLAGALLVGSEYAKAIAFSLDIPLVGINHLEGHLRAAALGTTPGFAPLTFPCVALLVSGGHTSIVHAEHPGVYTEVGRTLDDAAGECWDKVSKELGLGYPGGAIIDKLARDGNPAAIDMPRPMLHKGGDHFSFSGLKTYVLYHLREHGRPTGQDLHDLAASFQEAACEVLVKKTLRVARRLNVKDIVVSGGVACNRRLREMVLDAAGRRGLRVCIPPPSLCTDNAAMIGAAAYPRLARHIAGGAGFAEHTMNVSASWAVDDPPPEAVRTAAWDGPPL